MIARLRPSPFSDVMIVGDMVMEQEVGALSGSREPSPTSGLGPSGFDPAREIERLYSLAKANNALARMNAKRAEAAEAKLAEQEGHIEWVVHMRDDALAKRDAMYLARQDSERALDRVKACLERRSEPTMDPPWTAAFNAALDMVGRALRDSDGSGEADETGTGSAEGDSAGLKGIAITQSLNNG